MMSQGWRVGARAARLRRFVLSMADLRAWVDFAKVVNHHNYDHVQPRRKMQLAHGVRISPTASFRNGERISGDHSARCRRRAPGRTARVRAPWNFARAWKGATLHCFEPAGSRSRFCRGNWSGPQDRVTRYQAIMGRQGRPSASMVRAAKKWMPWTSLSAALLSNGIRGSTVNRR